MKRAAYLFPGQGAQYPGMGKDFFDVFAISRETFEEADEYLGERLSKIIFEGPEAVLTQTKHSQLAIFVNSAAILRALIQQLPDLKPAICAGLSLGEYTALFASGRLGFKETLFLVRERSRLMNDACEKIPGTMAAVLGLHAPEVEAAVKGLKGVWVANYNCPGQTVISGTKEGVEKGAEALKARGAKRVLPLTVHGAFHSGLMQPAQDALAPFIAAAPIRGKQCWICDERPWRLRRVARRCEAVSRFPGDPIGPVGAGSECDAGEGNRALSRNRMRQDAHRHE